MTLDAYLTSHPDRCPDGYSITTQHPGLCACTQTPPVAPDRGSGATGGHTSDEWTFFVAKCQQVRRGDGTVHACDLRPLLRAVLDAKTIGRLYSRARREGLLVEAGTERSDDDRGRNRGRWEPYYSLGVAA